MGDSLLFWGETDFPAAFFAEGGEGLAFGGVEEGLFALLGDFGEIGEGNYGVALEISQSFVERFHEGKPEDVVHFFRAAFLIVVFEGQIIELFFFVAKDDWGETEFHQL